MNRKTILCPRCDGSGYLFDHAAGIFTFGLAYIFQLSDDRLKNVCPRCKGKGYIEIR